MDYPPTPSVTPVTPQSDPAGQPQPVNQSPVEPEGQAGLVEKAKAARKRKIVIISALAVLVSVLAGALGISIYLTQQQQDVRQQADQGVCGTVQAMDASEFTSIDTTGDLVTEVYRPTPQAGRRYIGFALIADDAGNRFEIEPIIRTTGSEEAITAFSSSDCPKTTNPGSRGWYDLCNENSRYTFNVANFQQNQNELQSVRFRIHFYDAESGGTRHAYLKNLRWRYIDSCDTPTASPSPSPSPTPSPTPTPTPSPTPSVTPSPSPTPSPTPSLTPSPTPTPTPTLSCNSECTTNAQCQSANRNYICTDEGVCRLDSNPASPTCAAAVTQTVPTPSPTPTQVAQTQPQPELPAELPQTGPEDWGTWLKVGVASLGVGALLLLLL